MVIFFFSEYQLRLWVVLRMFYLFPYLFNGNESFFFTFNFQSRISSKADKTNLPNNLNPSPHGMYESSGLSPWDFLKWSFPFLCIVYASFNFFPHGLRPLSLQYKTARSYIFLAITFDSSFSIGDESSYTSVHPFFASNNRSSHRNICNESVSAKQPSCTFSVCFPNKKTHKKVFKIGNFSLFCILPGLKPSINTIEIFLRSLPYFHRN